MLFVTFIFKYFIAVHDIRFLWSRWLLKCDILEITSTDITAHHRKYSVSVQEKRRVIKLGTDQL